MKSLFVTGTDTDVGKTCVSASIVKNLRDMDIDVGVMKPFASGYKENSNSLSQDVEILMKYSDSHDPVDLVNPYFFEIPILLMNFVPSSLFLKICNTLLID